MSATFTEAPTPVVEPTRAWWSSRLVTALGGIALAAVVIGICSWPMLHENRYLLDDWFSHLWYSWHQEGSLRAHGLPSLYTQDASGVFDPHFAFYGATLYAITGAIALVVGHDAAYISTWILTFAMGYGAWFWLARQAGLGPWASHAPGILFVTSTWCLTSTYVLGSWAQTISFSSLVLVLAAAFSILRAERLRPLPALALAVGILLFTGSHNLSLVWATTVLAVVGAVALVFVTPLRALMTRRGVLRLAVIVIPATLVNGWFLVPAAVYQSHTAIGSDVAGAHFLLKSGMDLVSPGHVLTLTRTRADPLVPRYALQLPVLAILWTAVGLLVVAPRRSSPWLRTALLLLAVIVTTWVLMTNSGLVTALPHPYDMLQAGYRLEGYIQLALGGAVIAVLVLLSRATAQRRRLWGWALVAILAVTVLQARAQIREPLSQPLKGPPWKATPYLTPISYPGSIDYIDVRVPPYTPDRQFTKIRFSPREAERTDRAEATVNAQPGDYVMSNLKASPKLIHVAGAQIVARDPAGNAFLEIDSNAKPGAAHIVVTTAHPWPVMLGRLLTLLGLLGLAGVAVALLVSGRRASNG
jgi:hypothetical protein